MKVRMYGKEIIRGMAVTVGLFGILLWTPDINASTAPPVSVAKAPICKTESHPKIMQVTPDAVKPGQRIMIKGKNFGTKECFQDVSFGSLGASGFKYISESALEATVPNLKPGLVPVNILTGGGTSQFILLIQAK
jgi:hypothetical protein